MKNNYCDISASCEIVNQLKADLEKEKALKQTYLSCYKTKHGDAKGKLFKYEIYKQTLTEIKDYCNKYPQNSIGFKQQILQKCKVIDEEI